MEEMDVDAIVKRRPQVCIVDELAHTHTPDSRHGKRYEDALELLDAGIHVMTAVNILQARLQRQLCHFFVTIVAAMPGTSLLAR